MGQSEGSRRTGGTRRIYEALRDQIAAGIYRSGDRLPSSRGLAEELGVSRTTVTAAFDQLISEGYVLSRQGAVNVVAEQAGHIPHSIPATVSPTGDRLSAYACRLLDLPLGTIPVRPALDFDFRYGDIAAADFPTLLWRRAINAALVRRRTRLAYKHPAGNPVLRHELQAYLWRARGIRCDPDQIIVVSGSQQAVDLCARLLVDPGDRVVLEDPCYPMARNAIAAVGGEIHPVPCDGNGLMTSLLPDDGRTSLAFVTPSHQYPLGGVLPPSRREALIRWSGAAAAYVLEDDYDGEYRYDVKPIPPLYRSGHGRIIYIGTLSKTLSPTLRLGYLVLPKPLVEVFTRGKQITDRHSVALEQEALADLLASGAYERHVRKMRRSNAERRAALITALQENFGDAVEVAGSSAGLHIVVWFHHVALAQEGLLIDTALRHGIGIYPVSPLYLEQKPQRAGLVMGYASQSPGQIRNGVRRLAAALADMEPI